MKKLLLPVVLALAFGAMTAANAQVYFESGSARPNNPHAAQSAFQRQHRAHPPARPRERLVRCHDGARRIARRCHGHGGVARR
jgi:hypothetical protein